jgi:8-oxo-dGTP pyrophosphatase MutT (NUDIX family)
VIPVYAGAVVSAPGGRILCQLRDDKSDIICPGQWCCSPGGRVDEGECPVDAIVRELREEFEIEVENLKTLMTYQEDSGEFQGVYHAFYTDLITPVEKVKCNEGQRAEFFMIEQALCLSQHPVSLIFLKAFMKI